MADPLDPVLPPGTRARTEAEEFLELRARYRADQLKRVRAMSRKTELKGISTDAPAGRMFRSMEEYLESGGDVPQAGDTTFNILPVPQAKLDDLAGNAEGVLRGEQVRHAGNPTGDPSREGPPLESMDEESILAWTAANITQAGGREALYPHLGGEDGKEEPGRKYTTGNTPTSTDPGREVPAGDQSQDRVASAGEVPSQGQGVYIAPGIKVERRETTAQETEAFRKFWSEFSRKGSPPSLPSCGALPAGSTVEIPPEIAFVSGSRIWFAGRRPFRAISRGISRDVSGRFTGSRAPANPSPTLVASALWWRLLAEAVRHRIHLCWDRCRTTIARWRGR